jgi:hypothetical protein
LEIFLLSLKSLNSFNDNNHEIAISEDELKAITVLYHFNNVSEKGKIGMPYHFEKDEVIYQGFSDFSPEENHIVFQTRLKTDVDYFQIKEKIEIPAIKNVIGLTIKKSNNLYLDNTWCGIFGFESYRKPNGNQILTEYFALAMTKDFTFNNHNISTTELTYTGITFKSVSRKDTPIVFLPVIQTEYIIDVENKEIIEWENFDDLQAVVSGSGRDTFGLTYLATDYAENKAVYLSTKKLKIKISGIAFVLDISNIHQSEGELKYSENFTTYMPNKDLPNYACFDFVGQLEHFKEICLLEDNSLKGYLMKVRLITHPDISDFFTIDIFVTRENMRFKELTIGMKLTGMFQMQGQIAD